MLITHSAILLVLIIFSVISLSYSREPFLNSYPQQFLSGEELERQPQRCPQPVETPIVGHLGSFPQALQPATISECQSFCSPDVLTRGPETPPF